MMSDRERMFGLIFGLCLCHFHRPEPSVTMAKMERLLSQERAVVSDWSCRVCIRDSSQFQVILGK